MTEEKDPGHCGLDPFTTGDWDPYFQSGVCTDHDKAFDALKAGKPNDGAFKVAGDFIGGAILTAARGAYAVAMLPLYVAIGGIGGLFRWGQLEGQELAKKPQEPIDVPNFDGRDDV